MQKLTLLILLIAAWSLSACHDNDDDGQYTTVYKFDLNESDRRWQAGFADYPEGEETFYELSSTWTRLPAPLDFINGINLSGNNHSDDLLMYIKRRLDGLKPNARYALVFKAQIATNAASGCFGIGGAPGESVYVKAGATTGEPAGEADFDGFIRLDIDHGGNGSSGSDAIILGDLANTQTDCVNTQYELKNFDSSASAFEVFSDRNGVVWSIFATDSGFEGVTSIYFTSVEIRARQVL